jgi:hypothetical protein
MTITKIESGKYNVTTQKLTYIVRKVMHPIRHTPIGWEILDDHVTFKHNWFHVFDTKKEAIQAIQEVEAGLKSII